MATLAQSLMGRSGPEKRPPGPKGVPLLGSLPDLGRDVLGFFSSSARRYGDIVGFRLAGWPALLLSHPDFVEDVLVRNPRNFIKHRFFWRHVTAIFGEGLLTSEGEDWQRQRRLAASAFAGPRLNRYGDAMVRYTEAMLRDWTPGAVLDVHREAMAVTLKIAAKTLFDAEAEKDVATIHEYFDDVVAEIAARFGRPFPIPDFLPTPGNLRYRRGVRRIDDFVCRVMAEHDGASGDRGDLLSTFMAARDDAGRTMSRRQIRDNAVTLVLAGHETTALALCWTWHLLGLHPEADARLAEEARSVLGDRPPTVEDLPRLRFAEQVLTESMRLYPPAYAFGRETVGPCEIGGYPVAPGTIVYLSPWVMHHDARWFDEPHAFRPERWSGDLAKRLPRFAYMPFGGGARICIGNRFAVMEAVLILAAVARSFRLERTGESPVPMPSVTLRPKGGLRMRVVRR